MKLNNKEFKSLAEAIDYANNVAAKMNERYSTRFSADDAIIETSKGVINHIWMHFNILNNSYRLSFTADKVELLCWSDNGGWKLLHFSFFWLN